MTRVLVTGAGGFIGSNLTRNLVKTEDQINILIRETKMGEHIKIKRV